MMKLNFFFIVMDVFTLLVYPVLFVLGKIRQFIRVKENILLVNSLSAVLVVSDKRQV